MWHEERRQRIRSLLATFGRITVERITDEFGVSRETIRRDLLDMEGEGELRRVRGGAVVEETLTEPPFRERVSVRIAEKRMISAAAARLVRSGQTLFLDAGSTTSILAERLSALSGLTVITNSMEVANRISEHNSVCKRGNKALLIGGEFCQEPPSTFGAVAVNDLQRYRADLAMLSPFGLDLGMGASSFEPREAEIARAMVNNARDTVILADHVKLGVASRVSYCGLADISHVVVDRKAEQNSLLLQIRAQVGQVLVAARHK